MQPNEPTPPRPPPRRKATRWRGFDYATTGAYFVTICAERRRCLFGRIANDAMIANALGRAVEQVWAELPGHYAGVELDAFVLMPNHVHGIIVLQPANAQAPTSNVAAQALPEIVRAFKSFSARAVNRLRGAVGRPVWQRGFHDRIVRNERELERIRDYVANSPHAWAFDAENPDRRR